MLSVSHVLRSLSLCALLFGLFARVARYVMNIACVCIVCKCYVIIHMYVSQSTSEVDRKWLCGKGLCGKGLGNRGLG
jgi:hypothetical protein